MPPKVLTAGALRAWSVYGEINVKGLGSTLALLRTFNIAGVKAGSTMRTLTGAFQGLIKVTALAGFGFAALAIGTTRAFGNFDQAMTSSLAIMGDVSDHLREDMAMAARKVGKTTQFAAKEAARGYFYLASAGLTAEQSLAAMPQVAQFAQAGMFDLATATDLATDAQSALGLTVDDATKNLENMRYVTDVLVGANTLANATVEQFSLAITNKLGSRVRLLGKDMEEATAALAAFADQGVKGRVAGQRLTIILRDLPTVAIKNEEAFKKLGAEVFTEEGHMRNLADIVADLETELGALSVKQRTAAFMTLGMNKRAADGLALLIGMSDKMKDYEARLRQMGGITQEVADKQLGAFNLQMLKLKRTFADLAIEIGDHLAPKMFMLSESLRGWAEGLDTQKIARNITDMFSGILRGLAAVMRTIGNFAINVDMSMTMFAGLGLIGFLLMGPFGLALFPLVGGLLKNLLEKFFPDVFGNAVASAEQELANLYQEHDAMQQKLMWLRRVKNKGWRQELLPIGLQHQLAALGTGIADPVQHLIDQLVGRKIPAVVAKITEMTATYNDAAMTQQPYFQLMIEAADAMERIADAGVGLWGAGSGGTGPTVKPDKKEGVASWLPQELSPDKWFDPGWILPRLKPEDVPTDHIKTPIQEKLDAAMSEMGESAKWRAQSIGRSIINGIVNGSLEMKDVLKMVLTGILNVAMGGLFGFLGIASPSKLTMGVGRNIGEGLAMGMEQTRNRVAQAAMGLGGAVRGGFARTGLQSALSGPMSSGVAGAVAANANARGVQTINIKGVPGPITPREAARDAMWQDLLRESVMKARKDGFRFN